MTTLDVSSSATIYDLTVTDSLTVSGVASLYLTTFDLSAVATLSGILYADDLEVRGDASMTTLDVSSSATIYDLTVTDSLTVSGSASLYLTTFDLSAVATLSGILYVDDLEVRGDASMTTLDVSSTATIYDLTVTNTATISGTSFTGDITTNNRIILNPGNRHVWTYKDTYDISFDTTSNPPDRVLELSGFLFQPYTTFRGYFEDPLTLSGGMTHIKLPDISDISGFHPVNIELYLVNVSDGIVIQPFDNVGTIKRTGTLSGGTNNAYIEIKTFQKSPINYEYIARLYDLT
jgi:hypothetical protein